MDGRINKTKKKSLEKIAVYKLKIKQALKLDEELKILYNRKMAASEQQRKVLNQLIAEEVLRVFSR